MRRSLALALAAGTLLGLAAAGCQTYDFEPVLPVTLAQTTYRTVRSQQRLKPNLMALVDKSGSMASKINPACSTGCATRISELRSALGGFLTSSGTLARMGLTFFPSDDSCGPATHTAVDLPAPTATDTGTDGVLGAKATEITTAINSGQSTPNGGTPTAASLGFLGTLSGLTASDGRDDYVLLMTDGLPNCNGSNPNNVCACGTQSCPAQEALCRCTQSNCLRSDTCNIGCLDQDAATAAVAALNSKGIKTIVIGFGSDTAGGDARTVLNAMATAGGFARGCSDAEPNKCGASDTCDPVTRLCGTRFYQVGNGAELTTVLQQIGGIIFTGNPCQFDLSAQPSDPALLAVLVNGQSVAPGPDSWAYVPPSVIFADASAICQQIKSAPSSDPVTVEIRIVQRL